MGTIEYLLFFYRVFIPIKLFVRLLIHKPFFNNPIKSDPISIIVVGNTGIDNFGYTTAAD